REREDLFIREVTSGADCLGCCQAGMSLNPRLGDFVPGAQVRDQGLSSGDLPGCRRFLVEVADRANSDSIFLDVVGASVPAMNTLFLIGPALGDLDLAVRAAVAVADHEMVSAAIQTEDLAVFSVDLVIASTCGCAVVQHDVAPRPVGLGWIDQLVGA